MIKILVIDDQLSNISFIKNVLLNSIPDCLIISSQSGAEGIIIGTDELPDVILIDIVMPDMDGFEVCKKFRAIKQTKNIPIILVSAFQKNVESRIKGLKSGADVFLSKPIDPSELSAQVSSMLRIRQAEQATKKSEMQFREILNETRLHMWAFDGELYTYLNEEWYNYTGQDPTLPLTVDRWTELVHQDDLEAAVKIWKKHWETKTEHDNYFRLKRKDGVYRDFHCHAVPIFSKEGNFRHFQGYNIDITRRKQIESELIIAKEVAEESSKLKTAFIHNLSHEIRTPMNGILGFADLIMMSGLTADELQEYIGIIEKSGTRLLNTITDLMDISLLQSGQMDVTVSDTDINSEIRTLFTFFEQQAKHKGLTFTLKETLPVQESVVSTDKQKIVAILSKLIINAIKFTDNGSVEFGCGKKNNQLEFFVADTGIGIPIEKQQTIFESFIQVDNSNTRIFEGSGLGLAIIRAYVELLDGEIWVESGIGKGSTFYFNIPYISEVKEIEKYVDQTKETSTVNSNSIKILIVEDEDLVELYLSIMLKEIANELLFARNGIEAVELCRSNTDIDLILMDIKMPIMNGYEATREIRKFNKDVIIIAQTAYAIPGDRNELNEIGCNDYISKPISKNELMKTIDKYFG